MFNLELRSGEKKISYKPLSVSIRYLIEDKRLETSLNNIGLVIPNLFRDLCKNF